MIQIGSNEMGSVGVVAAVPPVRRKNGHTKPALPTIDINGPGRLRVKHVLALFAVSHSTLYSWMAQGKFPKPDGHQGRMPFWNTDTIRLML